VVLLLLYSLVGIQADADTIDSILDKEFELVKQAFYTEPEDQSSWLYHRWLLGRVSTSGFCLPCVGISLGINYDADNLTAESAPELGPRINEDLAQRSERGTKRQLVVYERELKTCLELLDVEPDCKWVLLTVALLLAGVDGCHASQEPASRAATGQRITSIFSKLELLDPMRKSYYVSVREKLMNGLLFGAA
jgi:geranylgeranyl transferase type-2 subunit alpha